MEVLGVKEKKRPELTDDFAKDLGEGQTIGELRGKVREQLDAAREHKLKEQTRDKVL